MQKNEYILASASPRRREILEQAGYEFRILACNVDETFPLHASPAEAVVQIAVRKAEAAKKIASGGVIIAADTVVVCSGKKLGKPQDREEADRFLHFLSGGEHEVLTGFCVTDGKKAFTGFEATKVFFRALTDKEIKDYVASGESDDKAGAYGIQGRGSVFVERVEGDFYNVMGLPICKINQIITSEF